jgi:hypothetical protein
MLKLAGENCERIMAKWVVNVPCNDVQVDEIWGYVQKKEAHKSPWEANDNSIGDAYTFVAIDADADSATDPANKCLLEEVGKSVVCDLPLLHVVQLCEDSSLVADHASDGSGDHVYGLGPRKSHLPALTTLPPVSPHGTLLSIMT